MKIKVCGLNDPENLREIASMPIDMVGMIFYKKSPRFNKIVPPEMPDLTEFKVKKVGVFVNAEIEEILNYVHDYQLDYIQLHGTESPEFCLALKDLWQLSSIRSARIIKAFSVDEKFDFKMTQAYERWCDLFLFDTKGDNPGGNGTRFNWDVLREYEGMTPFLLSGGIRMEDAVIIRQLAYPQLYGVDINSRFETKPGVKDVDMVKEFVYHLKI